MKLVGFFCEHFLLWREDEEENWVWEKNWQAEDKWNREIVFFGTDKQDEVFLAIILADLKNMKKIKT